MAEQCIFCKIVAGEIPAFCVYADDVVYAFLDVNPLAPGHCLLIPRAHYGSLDQCPDVVLSVLAGKIVPIAQAVVGAVSADGYNVLNNNGRAAGQLIDHVHFHIIPRCGNDAVISLCTPLQYEPGQAEQLTDRIKGLIG